MSFTDPQTVQNPTTGLVAPFGWGDAVNSDLNFLRNAKAGCHLTSLVGTATGLMVWGTELYDVNGCHDNAVNTGRITVPASWGGLWFVGCDLAMTTDIWGMSIRLNGTTGLVGQTGNVSGGVESMASACTIYPMAVGDYFDVFTTGGTARSTAQTSRFYAHWLHGI